LIRTAVELIGERGVRNFSLAEASRRLGVAPSAPYAHFGDRDELLAAVAVYAYERFYANLEPELIRSTAAADRLVAIARAYVHFAGTHRPLFEVVFAVGLDKARHPNVAAAEKPLDDAFKDCVRALSDSDDAAEQLATAVEAVAHGYAMLLIDGSLGSGQEAVADAAQRAGRATAALIQSRDVLAVAAEPDDTHKPPQRPAPR
jgi:AcrR family transcriptional regulator